MADKLKPNLEEFRSAVRAMYDCPNIKQADALQKVIEYAAFAAGYSAEQIKPRTLRTRRPFEDTTAKGWPL